MESIESIDEKLELYSEQLAQVDGLLADDASNEQFLKLRSDLEQVIALTKALRAQLLPEPGNPTQKPTGHDDNNNEENSQYSPSDAAAADGDAEGVLSLSKPLAVGDRVEVSGAERPFPAVITAVINATEFKAKYYSYADEVSLPLSCLSRLPAGRLRAADVSVGYACMAKYATDQAHYDCTVTALTQHGYMVTYTAYGTTEEVPLEYLQPRPCTPKVVPEEQKAKADYTGKLIPIPAKLTVLPTDTEEEKARKRKKLKVIKQHNRTVEIEAEHAQGAQQWQKFVKKAAVKRPSDGGSLFASSDLVNSKVGVTNSGKGTTAFVERKKHKFVHASAAASASGGVAD